MVPLPWFGVRLNEPLNHFLLLTNAARRPILQNRKSSQRLRSRLPLPACIQHVDCLRLFSRMATRTAASFTPWRYGATALQHRYSGGRPDLAHYETSPSACQSRRRSWCLRHALSHLQIFLRTRYAVTYQRSESMNFSLSMPKSERSSDPAIRRHASASAELPYRGRGIREAEEREDNTDIELEAGLAIV